MPIVPITKENTLEALNLLNKGEIVAFGTETVYGLGADATSAKAISKIYKLKNRPLQNPLIAHTDCFIKAFKEGIFCDNATKLAHKFWPGPLTLVVPRSPECTISELATNGLPTVALRIPKFIPAIELLFLFKKPIVAPSANISGYISPTTAQHVAHDFKKQDIFILDSGQTHYGLESTIVGFFPEQTEPVLLREGMISRKEIEDTIKTPLISASTLKNKTLHSPGMLSSHYAPKCPLRINATHVEPDESVLLFGSFRPKGIRLAKDILTLSERENLEEAAQNLYAHLRLLDKRKPKGIAVVSLPQEGLGITLTEKLIRASGGFGS